jgi:hypothetical protein
MPMRTDCRHYESRTYSNGEVVRKCRLDLAPEAPWRCPDDCPMFERRRIDVAWNYGTLHAANEAQDIVNSAAPDILAQFDKKKRRRLRRKKR